MKKIVAVTLSLFLCLGTLTACGNNTTQTTAETTQITLEECGLSYTIPNSWTDTEIASVVPDSYAIPEGGLYAVVCYNFIPDDNLEQINNLESTGEDTSALMPPLAEMIVIRDGGLSDTAVETEFSKFESKKQLDSQEGFQYYFLSEPKIGTDGLSEEAKEVYEIMLEDAQLLYESIETFVPDETLLTEKSETQSKVLSFITTDLEGNEIDSTVFADYDVTVLNFYASYSYPDINELQELEAFSKELKSTHKNVNFMQVIIDTPDAAAEEIINAAFEENGVTYTAIKPDISMADWIVSNLAGLPTTIFVNRDGVILDTKLEGKQTKDTYIDTTKQVLSDIGADTEVTEVTETTTTTETTE